MNIGGVGDIGLMGMTAGLAVGAPTLVGGLGIADPAAVSTVTGGRFDQLVQLISEFSTSEILMALMLAKMSASSHQRVPEAGDSGMESLLGLALMGQMSESLSGLSVSSNPGISSMQATLAGSQLNVQA